MLFNVQTYGAIGDAQLVEDGVTHNGTDLIESPSNPWLLADVGKIVWASYAGGVVTPLGTIIARPAAGQIQVSLASTVSVPANASIVWGTADDTAAFQAAYAAAVLAATIGGGQTNEVYVPRGGYLLSDRIFNSALPLTPGLLGDGRATSTLIVMPNMVQPAGAEGALINVAAGYGGRFAKFGIYGAQLSLDALIANASLVNIGGTQQSVREIGVSRIGSTTADTSAVRLFGTLDVDDLVVQGDSGSVASRMVAGFIQCSGLIANSLWSNFFHNLVLSGVSGRTPITIGLQFVGGAVDEARDIPAMLLGSIFQGLGMTFFTGSGSRALDVDATSRAYLRECDLGTFNNNGTGGTALNLDAGGGRCYASGCSFRSNAASPGGDQTIANPAGSLFVDMGGNDYANWTTGVGVPLFWRRAFSNPELVQRF